VTKHVLSALRLQAVWPSRISYTAFCQRTGVTHTFWRLLQCQPLLTAKKKNDL